MPLFLEKQAPLRTIRSVLLLPLPFFLAVVNLLSVLFLVRKGPLGTTRGAVSPHQNHQNRQNRQWSRGACCQSCFSTANVCCHCRWPEPPKPSNATHPLDHTPCAAFRDLVDVSEFFVFPAWGGEGGVRGAGGGGSVFLLEIPGGGGVSKRGRGRGAARVSAANWGFFGGGDLNIFFRGRNVHQDEHFRALSVVFCDRRSEFLFPYRIYSPYYFLVREGPLIGSRWISSTAKLRIWTLRIWGFQGPV